MEKGLISIDRWTEDSQAYFLTHLHADHTKGLSPSWSRGPLFCSPITARLLPSKFPRFDLSLLRVLEVGVTHALHLLSPTTGSPVPVLVTPIDAHHCPGAVMYLFRRECSCVLYTGDFRWESTSERAQLGRKMLLDALQGDKVDVLYLDNTYCHPSFLFPPRDVAAQQVVQIISLHPDHDIIIGVDTLGKENLLLHISEALGTKIWVWPERLQTMHLLGFDETFTTKTSLTRVRAVPRYSLTFDTLEALNTVHPTIGIMPSGLQLESKNFDNIDGSFGSSMNNYQSKRRSATGIQTGKKQTDPPKMFQNYVYMVPYSEHSCFTEIQEFIELVQPSHVTGIVSSSFCYINPRHYFRHLFTDRPSQKNFKKEPAENVDVDQNQSSPGYKSYGKIKARKQGTTRISCLSMRRSKLCTIRKDRRGAKIASTDGIGSSDLNVESI